MLVVYDSEEKDFISNGNFVLDPYTLKATVKEELNGVFNLEIELTNACPFLSEIKEEMIIKSPTPKDEQPFRIRSIRRDLKKTYLLCRHYVFDLQSNFITDINIVGKNGAAALTHILNNTVEPHNFTCTSNIATQTNMRIVRYNVFEALAGDKDNCFLNRWGGEIEYDRNRITINESRGLDRGFQIRHRKNLTGFEQTLDTESIITKIMPIGFDGMLLPEEFVVSPIADKYENVSIKKIEFGNVKVKEKEDDEEGFNTIEEAYEELRCLSNEMFSVHHVDKPYLSCRINFIELSKTEEYKDYAVLERVFLGDVINVYIPDFDINIDVKVQSYTFDVIKKRYTTIVVGEKSKSLFGTINAVSGLVTEIQQAITSGGIVDIEKILNDASTNAGNLINQGLKNSHVIVRENEQLIMDTKDIMTAQKVWRWNLGGLAFSNNGYAGPYKVAITQDGAIVADFITAGVINGALIRAGSIEANQLSVGATQTIRKGLATEENLANLTFDVMGLKSTVSKNKTDAEGKITSLDSKIEQTATNITTTVNANKKDAEGKITELGSKIDQTAEGITLSVSKKYSTKEETEKVFEEAKKDATTKASEAKYAAENYAKVKSEAERVIAEAYADGIVTEEEAARIAAVIKTAKEAAADAKAKADAAKIAAENAANLATDEKLKKYSTTTEMNTKIDQTAEGITLSVSKKYSTKEEAKLLTERVTYAESKITDSAITNTVKKEFYTKTETNGQITSKGYQTASEVQQTVDKVEFKFSQSGGYNHVRNGDGRGDTRHWNVYHFPTSARYSIRRDSWTGNEYAHEICVSSGRGEHIIAQYVEGLIPGKTYTASCMMAGHRASNVIRIINKADNKVLATSNVVINGNGAENVSGWTTAKVTFTATEDCCRTRLICMPNADNGHLWAKFVQIEEGSIATPFSPHKGELYEGITAIDGLGVIVGHNDGSFTRVLENGLKRRIRGVDKDYHYLNYHGVATNVPYGDSRQIQLPADFVGKEFEVVITANRIHYPVNGHALKSITTVKKWVNHATGRFNIHNGTTGVNYMTGADLSYLTVDVDYVAYA